jgi:hypothetical protein
MPPIVCLRLQQSSTVDDYARETSIMKITSKVAIITLAGTVSISALATRALAQKGESGEVAIQPLAGAELTEDASPEQTPSAPTPQKTAADPDNVWHFSLSPYIWFAGMHGTVGALGHDVSVHASFGDIFEYLNLGLMVAGEPRYKRFGAPVDFFWMKLSDDKSLPFEVGPNTVKAKINESVLSPKVAYRLLDGEMVKVDGNFGIRYFHLGTTLDFVGTGPQPSFYQSSNWVDYTGGARIVAALSPKILVTILGDAGAGGANLDYQVGGALGYKIKPNIILQAGWRYMDVDYRPPSTFVYDVAVSGLLIGATFNLK